MDMTMETSRKPLRQPKDDQAVACCTSTAKVGRQTVGSVMGFRETLKIWLVAVTFIALVAFPVEANFGKTVSRAVHRLRRSETRPSGVTWVVQLSDLHLSLYYPERAQAFEKLMPPIIAMIQPSLVIVSGDLTDAKNKDGSTTQQYEEDWIAYERGINAIRKESGIELTSFYDLRGNHDKYGVPYANSSLDYYSRYSCNARQNRTGLVQSITLMDDKGWKILFVGVDDSMSVGLRGPSNIFGHPSDQTIDELDMRLSQWDNDTSTPVTKIVYGHFPMSFTTSSESGRRSQDVMTKHNISGFLCGHLHCKFGRQLYKHHITEGVGEFWEWEMGDWRVNRMMRVVAIDHGRVSFVDVDLQPISKDVMNGKELVMPTIIVPTRPVDSRIMLRSSSTPDQAYRGGIRALVFSKSRPASVTASVFDSVAHPFVDYVLLESVRMDLVSGPSGKEQGGAFFYEAVWDSRNYTDASATRYWLQIQVIEDGVKTTTNMWPFSVDGKKGSFSLTFLGFVAIGVQWDAAYPVILWTIMCVIVGGFLILPRLVLLYLERKGVYDSWAYSIFHPDSESKFPYFKLPLWALLEGARHTYLWSAQILYIAFLLMFPWFWGKVLADDYPIGYMTFWGWTVWPSKGTVAHQSGQGWPDIMGIVLPYMCAVVLPMILMVSALCAEQAACELFEGSNRKPEELLANGGSAKKTNGRSGGSSSIGLGRILTEDAEGEEGRPLLESVEGASLSTEEELESASEDEDGLEAGQESAERPAWSFLHRKVRKTYFVACFIIAGLHLELCLLLASAYGAQSVFLSPIYVWTVPTLILTSIFMTSQIKPRNL
ncbi:unnamed protein product [Calypogeia fissa]